MKRFFAWAGILSAAAVLLALLYFTATGAPANVIMGLLFMLIAIPTVIYGFLLFLKASRKGNEEDDAE